MRISDWSSDVCSSDLGTLPAAWPRTPDMADGALFPLGYGLTYASPATPWAPLPEVAVDAAADRHSWFAKGVPAASWSLVVAGPGGDRQTRLTAVPAQALGGGVIVPATDHRRSEEHTSDLQSIM